MSDVDGAPADSGISVITPAADTPAELSLADAARALAAARYRQKEPAPADQADADPVEPELDAQASDADPEEVPGEEPKDDEPAAEPPIERPRSWTKEEDDEWQSLPRSTQQKIVAREQERDAGLRRSQNEAAEKLKGLTAKEQQVEKARQEYEARLPAIMQALQDAQAGAFSDVKTMDDVTKLAAEDPFRYLQWQAHQSKMAAVNAEMTKADERKSQEQTTQWAQHIQTENALADEHNPELADARTGAALRAKAPDYLIKEIGFTDQDLAKFANGEKVSLFDHRVQRLILNGLKYSEIKAAPAKALPKPVPPVARPGASRPQGAAQSEAIQALDKRLTQSGTLKDAIALRAQQLNRRRA